MEKEGEVEEKEKSEELREKNGRKEEIMTSTNQQDKERLEETEDIEEIKEINRKAPLYGEVERLSFLKLEKLLQEKLEETEGRRRD